MLCVADLGLGSMWICYFNPDVLKREFELGKDIESVNVLAFGYADESGSNLHPVRFSLPGGNARFPNHPRSANTFFATKSAFSTRGKPV